MAESALLHEQHRTTKPASRHTRALHRAFLKKLPFGDRQSFVDAGRGFIASFPDGEATVKRESDGKIVFDLESFSFLQKRDAPFTVNPSLWRQAQLTTQFHGLFEVVPGLYQVRNYDMANMSLVRGQSGWILIDPLTSTETSRAALNVANHHLGHRDVVAVIYTHSHADHFLGVDGVLSPEDLRDGKVTVVAPRDFVNEALSENIIAGPAMARRSNYMYGAHLPRGPRGYVTSGLGPGVAQGSVGFAPPTDVILRTGEKRTVDGIEIEFLMTMGSEAPSEFIFYFPQLKALCMSEITSHHLHNLYTPRGAQVRDSNAWAQQIQDAIDAFGDDVEVQFASHHWPIWGRGRIVQFLEEQRDLYKYIHDETLRFAAHGLTAEEIANRLFLPEALATPFHNRPYYGAVFANVRAVYNKYLGFFSGNPAELHPLPPTELARKYVDFMGGDAELMRRARASFDAGEYRWVATVLNHLVLDQPRHQEARAMLADAYEQLGYQAESAPWRNFYLSGALELREGYPSTTLSKPRATTRLAASIPTSNFFQALAVRLNGEKAAASEPITITIVLEDVDENWELTMKHGVLWHRKGRSRTSRTLPDVSLTFPAAADFRRLLGGTVDFASLVREEKATFQGDITAFARLFSLMDKFPVRFPIVTPRAKI